MDVFRGHLLAPREVGERAGYPANPVVATPGEPKGSMAGPERLVSFLRERRMLTESMRPELGVRATLPFDRAKPGLRDALAHLGGRLPRLA